MWYISAELICVILYTTCTAENLLVVTLDNWQLHV